MCPRGQHGGRAAHRWIGTVAQRVRNGPSQTSQAQHRSDDRWIEILTQQRLVFVPALEQAGSVEIGGATQHARGDPLDASTSCCCFRR